MLAVGVMRAAAWPILLAMPLPLPACDASVPGGKVCLAAWLASCVSWGWLGDYKGRLLQRGMLRCYNNYYSIMVMVETKCI